MVNTSRKSTGVQQSRLPVVYNSQVVKRANSILSDCTQPLHQEFQSLPSGTRLRFLSVKTNRYKHSFIPTHYPPQLREKEAAWLSWVWRPSYRMVFMLMCDYVDAAGRICWCILIVMVILYVVGWSVSHQWSCLFIDAKLLSLCYSY